MALQVVKNRSKCPFCERHHWIHVIPEVPVQRFDFHGGTVRVTVRVLKHDWRATITEETWEMQDHRTKQFPSDKEK